MNENELYVVKENKFDNPPITDIDSIIENCFNDCRDNYCHEYKYECIFDFRLENMTNNEIINLTISDKSVDGDGLNNELKVFRQNGFEFDQINKLTIKFYSHLRYINVSFYLKFPIPMCHRQYFRKISQNRGYIINFYNNDREQPFNYAIRKWFNQLT